MTEQTQPSLLVRAQYIKDLSFENPTPLQSFTEDQDTQPNISVNIGVQAEKLGEGNFEVFLKIRADAKRNDKVMFIAELTYASIIGVEGNVSDQQAAPLVMIEAPHLMFPFARNIMADMTRDGGFPPLLLAPVDFVSLFQQQHDAAAQGNQAAAAPSA